MTREERAKYLNQLIIPNLFDNSQESCELRMKQEMALKETIEELMQEPCGDVVSRQAVLELVADYDLSMGQVVRGIHALPPVTPQPKVGKWIKTPKAVMGEGYMWYCDKCEYQVYQDNSRSYPSEKFCPNCGQPKMQEVEE